VKIVTVLTAATGFAAVVMFAGCSGGMQSASNSPGASLPQTHAQLRSLVLASGVDTRFAGPARILSRLSSPLHHRRHRGPEPDLFVSNASTEVVVLKNGTYAQIGTITSGLNGSDGVWVDPKGNVYVANYNGANVTEYKAGKGSPICTYSTGITDPINVTTDTAGNVYIDDFNHLQTPGYIDVFGQCSNTMKKQYAVSSGPEGVAVDKAGDIFVLYFGNNGGNFEEFKGGSTTPTPLGASITSPGGLILDKNGNLIADDQSGSIDVVAPPYSSAKVLVSGLGDPFHDSLNLKENLLFNANSGTSNVTVYNYPAGTLVTTLGSGNGITAAEGVGESPNAVF
jgi:hypothetical protein